MKSINKKLENLSKVSLEDFDIDVLKIMHAEIKRKQESLHYKIDEINKSIKGANVYKEFYGERNYYLIGFQLLLEELFQDK
tara:strand:- start:2586 stop:2828 length:243 start_codon:yes stop_codon:yes gene_type:complete